jgi:hypothetical protein
LKTNCQELGVDNGSLQSSNMYKYLEHKYSIDMKVWLFDVFVHDKQTATVPSLVHGACWCIQGSNEKKNMFTHFNSQIFNGWFHLIAHY